MRLFSIHEQSETIQFPTNRHQFTNVPGRPRHHRTCVAPSTEPWRATRERALGSSARTIPHRPASLVRSRLSPGSTVDPRHARCVQQESARKHPVESPAEAREVAPAVGRSHLSSSWLECTHKQDRQAVPQRLPKAALCSAALRLSPARASRVNQNAARSSKLAKLRRWESPNRYLFSLVHRAGQRARWDTQHTYTIHARDGKRGVGGPSLAS